MGTQRSIPKEVSASLHKNRTFDKCRILRLANKAPITGEDYNNLLFQEECPKNPGLGVAENLKKPSQTPRGVPVGSKMGFKSTKVYRPVDKKPTVNTSGNKKKGPIRVESRSGMSKRVVPVLLDKIGKLEKLIIEGKVTLVDDNGKPLKNVDYPRDHDSDDEVCSVDNNMARFMATETVGFGT
ncbi:hypothetical protein Tco_1484972 [Tanacetum coccineum]